MSTVSGFDKFTISVLEDEGGAAPTNLRILSILTFQGSVTLSLKIQQKILPVYSEQQHKQHNGLPASPPPLLQTNRMGNKLVCDLCEKEMSDEGLEQNDPVYCHVSGRMDFCKPCFTLACATIIDSEEKANQFEVMSVYERLGRANAERLKELTGEEEQLTLPGLAKLVTSDEQEADALVGDIETKIAEEEKSREAEQEQ